MNVIKILNKFLLLSVAACCPSLVLAHGDHQHIGGALALIEHLAAHVDYLVVGLLAVVGIIVWMKSPGA